MAYKHRCPTCDKKYPSGEPKYGLCTETVQCRANPEHGTRVEDYEHSEDLVESEDRVRRIRARADRLLEEQPELADRLYKRAAEIERQSVGPSSANQVMRGEIPLGKRLIEKLREELEQTIEEKKADKLVDLVFHDVQLCVNKATRLTLNDLTKLRTKAQNIIKSRTAQALQIQHNLVMDGVLHYSGGEDVMFYKFISLETGIPLVGKVYNRQDGKKASDLFALSKKLRCSHIVEYIGDAITTIQHEMGVQQSVLLMPSFDYSLKELLDGLHHQVPPATIIVKVVEALCYAGLAFETEERVHGDIKPANVMVKAGCVCLIDYNGTKCGDDVDTISQQYSLDSHYAPCSTALDAVCAFVTIAEMVRVWPITMTGYGTVAGLTQKLKAVKVGQDEIPEGVEVAVDVALELLEAVSFKIPSTKTVQETTCAIM